MKNFVISLDNANQRRTHISQEFAKHGVAFEFFDAITPDTLAQANARHNLPIDEAFLSAGEVGCLLSHVCLWQKMVDDNIAYAGIFEDDIHLGNNAHAFFSDDDWLQNNGIDLVKTETFLQYKKLGKVHLSYHNRTLRPLKEVHWGTAGYILSQRAAGVLLDYIKQKPTLLPIDHIMFEQFLVDGDLPVYQLCPAICAQDFVARPSAQTIPSGLNVLREARHKSKPKRPLSAKIKGELGNAYKKTLAKLVETFIDFE